MPQGCIGGAHIFKRSDRRERRGNLLCVSLSLKRDCFVATLLAMTKPPAALFATFRRIARSNPSRAIHRERPPESARTQQNWDCPRESPTRDCPLFCGFGAKTPDSIGLCARERLLLGRIPFSLDTYSIGRAEAKAPVAPSRPIGLEARGHEARWKRAAPPKAAGRSGRSRA